MSSIRRINCENCSAPYAINVATLRKEKNTVTCRRCKHKMIVYKSGFSEPENEQARVVQEDEKTLVDDEPSRQNSMANIQQEMPVLDTEISTKPPPLSVTPNVSGGTSDADENKFDQTARPEDFAPLHSRQNLRQTLSEDSTSPRSQSISPREARAPAPVEKAKAEPKFKKASPATGGTRVPAGLSMMLTVVSAMIFLAMLGSFGQYYVADEVGQKISLIVSISSLMLAFFLVLTSSFGKKSSAMGLSVGLTTLITAALGAGLFVVGASSNSTGSAEEPKEEIVSKKEEKKTEAAAQPDAEKGAEKEVVAAKTSTKKSGKSSSSTRTSSRRASAVISEPKNPRIEAPEPSMELPKEEEKVAIADPLEEDIGDEDLALPDLGDMDLDMDEEPKKSRFARKEKDTQPAPKVEATKKESPKAATKIEIPQSVMDIIIRNNKDVKGCYVSHRAEHGDFPKKVEVLFTLQPSGKVSQAYIAEGPHVGSKFESCLRSAFKKMTFPAFDSSASPQSLRYTLKI